MALTKYNEKDSNLKKIALSLSLLSSLSYGIGLGNYQVTPEIGASGGKSYWSNKFESNDYNVYGGYARVWLGMSRVVLAPQVKITKMKDGSIFKSSGSVTNNQYGLLLGYEVPILPLTPYVGASYSTFSNSAFLDDAVAFNYGIKIDVPIIPFLTIGIDASYQKPKYKGSDFSEKMHTIQGTIGLAF